MHVENFIHGYLKSSSASIAWTDRSCVSMSLFQFDICIQIFENVFFKWDSWQFDEFRHWFCYYCRFFGFIHWMKHMIKCQCLFKLKPHSTAALTTTNFNEFQINLESLFKLHHKKNTTEITITTIFFLNLPIEWMTMYCIWWKI